MTRTPVTSSDLVSVGYDPSSKTLEIEFKESRVYQYYDVPAETYSGLMAAPSHGKYFHAYIKDKYDYREV